MADLLYSKTIAYVLILVTTSDVYLLCAELTSTTCNCAWRNNVKYCVCSSCAPLYELCRAEQSLGWRSIEQGTAWMIKAEPKIMLKERQRFFYNFKQNNLDKSSFCCVCFLLGKTKLFKSELMCKVKKT